MNFIDVLFLALFVGGLALGFFQGMIRLLVILVACYLSLVLASLYFPAVGSWFASNFGARRDVANYMGFFVVLFLSTVMLGAAGMYTFRYAALPGRLQFLDRIVGVVLGLIVGALIIGVAAALLYNMMIVRGGAKIEFPIMGWLGGQVQSSFLLGYFARSALPMVYAFLDPFLPDGAAIVFRAQ